jgi:hypothetical protein
MRSPGRYEISLHNDASRDEIIVRMLSESLLAVDTLSTTRDDWRRTLWLAAWARRTVRPCVLAPTLTRGDCLVLEYRLLHRGLANATLLLPPLQHGGLSEPMPHAGSNRTILVVAIAQPWFKDVVNFPHRSLYDKPTNDNTAPSDNATHVDKEV